MNSQVSFRPVRIGVIGLGRFGRLHSLNLSRLSEAELVAIVARRADSVAALQQELPQVAGWTDLDLAMAESGAEAWVVACTTAAHVEITRRLLTAGYPVLLEKPVSESLAEAESLRPLVRADSSNLMLGHIALFNSEFRSLRDEVETLREVSYIDCVRHRPASIVRDFPGENPLHAAMVHDLYLVQSLLKRADPTEFDACYHRTAAGAIDLAIARLRWAGGAVASLAASYLTPVGMPPRGFDRMEVFGNGWAARINPNPRNLEVWDERARWPLALEICTAGGMATGMLAEELRCFCRVVRGAADVPVGATYEDALQVQRWMNCLQAAAESSGPVAMGGPGGED